jgi:cell division septum initiation protein DivIVA
MDLENLIDALEELLQRAVHIPGGKALVDEATFRQILTELRSAVPDQLAMGSRIASERERILAEARAQAQRILDDARSQLNARLDDQAIVQAARQRAKEIQIEAEQKAATLRTETNQYVAGQLGGLEARLQRLLREVQAGQRVLSQDRTESGGQS